MKKTALFAAALTILGLSSWTLQASPEAEMKAFQSYFQERFPDTEFQDFVLIRKDVLNGKL